MAETDFILKFADKVDVPLKCKDCPMLRRLEEHHDTGATKTNRIAGFAMSGEIERSLLNSMAIRGMSEEEVDRYRDEHKDDIHQFSNGLLDSMYDGLDLITKKAQETIDECHEEGAPKGEYIGTLKMRAKRAGKQVLVTLCMSERMARYTAMTPMSTELVVVERTDLSD